MIEVSTDEVVAIKATKDFAAVETTPVEVKPLAAEQSNPMTANPMTETLAELPVSAIAKEIAAKYVSTKPQANPAPNLQPNWPSPVVYPLRPTRKLRSLAAVDLPTFPK